MEAMLYLKMRNRAFCEWGLRLVDLKEPNRLVMHAICNNCPEVAIQAMHSPQFDPRANNNEAIRFSCYFGHLDVVKHLVTHFGITKDDVCVQNNFPLWISTANGHHRVAGYLKTHFKLDDNNGVWVCTII